MSFDRIGNLGKSSTMKARLQEEVRLVEIAQGTRVSRLQEEVRLVESTRHEGKVHGDGRLQRRRG